MIDWLVLIEVVLGLDIRRLYLAFLGLAYLVKALKCGGCAPRFGLTLRTLYHRIIFYSDYIF